MTISMEINFNIDRVEQTTKFKKIFVLVIGLANLQLCMSYPDRVIWKN